MTDRYTPQKFIVIIAGGRGERFWPQSRLNRPKHLLPIVGTTPMLVQTIDRVGAIVPMKNILIITSAQQENVVRAVCAQLPRENIIAEPVGRDTAPAVALASALVAQRDPDGVFAVLPADHVIHDNKAYQKDLSAAFAAASAADVMVTIGIKPQEPATGFGYIHRGTFWKSFERRSFCHAPRFVEKPTLSLAEQYVSSGEYLWNAGMFIWRVPVVEAALAKHAAELCAAFEPVRDVLAKRRPVGPVLRMIYPKLPKVSIDYALLEKSDNVVLLSASFDWDDVGAWPAVAKHCKKDEHGNVMRGHALVDQGSNNIVFSEGRHLLAVVGVADLIVVHTPDATLVCPKSRSQEIKALLKRVEAQPNGKRWL